MNNSSTLNRDHPDITQLDQLRSGLLDDRPAVKTRLLDHVRDCAPCREHIGAINDLVAAMRAYPDRALDQQLRARRRAALAGDGAAVRATAARRSFAPAFALVTVIALVVGVASFFEFKPAPPPVAQDVAQAPGESVPDVYADIDFYLWLTNHPAAESADTDKS